MGFRDLKNETTPPSQQRSHLLQPWSCISSTIVPDRINALSHSEMDSGHPTSPDSHTTASKLLDVRQKFWQNTATGASFCKITNNISWQEVVSLWIESSRSTWKNHQRREGLWLVPPCFTPSGFLVPQNSGLVLCFLFSLPCSLRCLLWSWQLTF